MLVREVDFLCQPIEADYDLRCRIYLEEGTVRRLQLGDFKEVENFPLKPVSRDDCEICYSLYLPTSRP